MTTIRVRLSDDTVAVCTSVGDDVKHEIAMRTAMRRRAHYTGNTIDPAHCPFCGSGAIFGRSDGTIECQFCTAAFTVQIQPLYPAYPMTDPTTGQPIPYPGQPAPVDVVGPPDAAVAPSTDGEDGQSASVNGSTAPPFGRTSKVVMAQEGAMMFGGRPVTWDQLIEGLAASR